MRGPNRRRFMAALAAISMFAVPAMAGAEDAHIINYKADKALNRLMANSPETRELLDKARGVLIMPEINKAGLLIGGAYGEGALRIGDQTVGYYAVTEASFGLQAGAQRTSQALLFMTTAALEKFRRSEGWELGASAEYTLLDKGGKQAGITNITAQSPVIAITFGEEGLMAGVSLDGAKYTKIKR